MTTLSRALHPEQRKDRAASSGKNPSSRARTSSQTSVLQLWHLVHVTDTPVTPIAFRLAIVGGGPGVVRWSGMAERFDSKRNPSYISMHALDPKTSPRAPPATARLCRDVPTDARLCPAGGARLAA